MFYIISFGRFADDVSMLTDHLWSSSNYCALEISVAECTYIQDFRTAAGGQDGVQGPDELTLDVILGPLDVKAEARKL